MVTVQLEVDEDDILSKMDIDDILEYIRDNFNKSFYIVEVKTLA